MLVPAYAGDDGLSMVAKNSMCVVIDHLGDAVVLADENCHYVLFGEADVLVLGEVDVRAGDMEDISLVSVQQASAVALVVPGALRLSPRLYVVLAAVALGGGLVMKSHWGDKIFPTLGDSAQSVLRGLKKGSAYFPESVKEVAGTVEGNMREILNVADKTMKRGLDVAKDSLAPMEKGVNEYVEKMLDDIHTRVQKEVARQVKLQKVGLEGAIELTRSLWNKSLRSVESMLDRLLNEIFDAIDDEERSLRSIVDPQQKRRELFQKLGLDDGASFEEVRKRYREIVKKTHPDAHGGDDSKIKEFYKAHKAYTVLKELMKD
ncbi:MAG: J domain-containing protein [Proteobacteria bacterium]|nr:J domain-containing protein [Pseudomonadota bacterium]